MRTDTWKRAPLALAAIVGAGLAAAAPATAAPTASTPPAISGTPAYRSSLSCTNGTWSAGAGSYAYSWQLADGNVPIGTGPKLRVRAVWVGQAIVCAVTAKDSSGTATAVSPPVTAAPAAIKVRITKARQTTSRRIEIEGTISPTASLNGGDGSLILYRETSAGPVQLSFSGDQTRPKHNGSFRLVAGDQPIARSTYVVQYVPSAEGYLAQAVASRKIRVRS